jgi:hypothetical protein
MTARRYHSANMWINIRILPVYSVEHMTHLQAVESYICKQIISETEKSQMYSVEHKTHLAKAFFIY